MPDKYQKWYGLKEKLENSGTLTGDLLEEFKTIMPEEYQERLKETCINFINEELVHNFEKEYLMPYVDSQR